jgi:flagellar basal body P-ring formation protein FlgA
MVFVRSAMPLLMIASLLCGGVAHASVELSLHAETELMTASYCLGDIAAIKAESPVLQQRLSALVVGKSPRPGYWGYATRQQLAAQIARAFPELHRQLEWSGALKTRIKAGGVAFPGERISETAQTYLSARLGAEHEHFSIGLIEATASPLLPQAEVTLAPRLPAESALSKRMPVQVDMIIEGEIYHTVTVWFSVSAYAHVLTANQDIPALAALQESAFNHDYRDIAALNGIAVVESAALEGMRLLKPLAQGSVLSAAVLEPLPAVIKGQKVAVYAYAGKVALRTTAIALSDGAVSQQIRVRHNEDSINYPAVVIGQGRVRVD